MAHINAGKPTLLYLVKKALGSFHSMGPQDRDCKLKKKNCKLHVNKTRISVSTNKTDKVAFCFHCGSYLEKLPMWKCYCMAQNRQYKQTNLLYVSDATSGGFGYHLACRLLSFWRLTVNVTRVFQVD